MGVVDEAQKYIEGATKNLRHEDKTAQGALIDIYQRLLVKHR